GAPRPRLTIPLGRGDSRAVPGWVGSSERDRIRPGGRMVEMDTIWDPQAERMSVDERADLQARRLDELLGRLAEQSPLYRERLAGARPGPPRPGGRGGPGGRRPSPQRGA